MSVDDLGRGVEGASRTMGGEEELFGWLWQSGAGLGGWTKVAYAEWRRLPIHSVLMGCCAETSIWDPL